MSNERKKRTWPWIVALVISLPVVYLVSFGPACWISSRARIGANAVSTIYHPITTRLFEVPFLPSSTGGITKTLQWYSSVRAAPEWQWQTNDVDLGRDGGVAGPKNWYWGH